MCLGLRVETHEGRVRVEVQQMLDTCDIEAQRRRTGARALVTVFSDARALLESVMEDEFVGNRTHGSFAEVQGAGPEQGLVYLAVGKETETERERELFLQLDWYFYLSSCFSSSCLLHQHSAVALRVLLDHCHCPGFEMKPS